MSEYEYEPEPSEVIENESWFDRIKQSIKGVAGGAGLFLLAFPVLFFNEGHAVKRADDLAFGKDNVVAVEAANVSAENDGKLVHLFGQTEVDEVLTDPKTGVRATGVRLVRKVEMYQWKEEVEETSKKKAGGGKQTKKKYSYRKEWSENLIDSSRFQQRRRHRNPSAMPMSSKEISAREVNLGAFSLSEPFKNMMIEESKIEMTDEALSQLPRRIRRRYTTFDGGLYRGNPDDPAIGDVRIQYAVVKPAIVSVVGAQTGNAIKPYASKEMTTDIALLQYGQLDAAAMFSAAEAENAFMTWVMRLVGFAMMFGGLMMLFKPLSVLGDVIPFIGSMLEFGSAIVAGVISVSMTLLTISIGWVFYRPLLGVPLLLISLGVIGWFGYQTLQKAKLKKMAKSIEPGPTRIAA